MNFKTTIILLLLLVGGITFVLVANRENKSSGQTTPQTTNRDPNGSPLVDIKPEDINGLTIHSSDGQTLQLAKAGNDWKLTSPIDAPADRSAVNTLLRTITDLRTRGKVPLSGDTLSASGLGKPQYTIEATTTEGKNLKLEIGNRSALGNDLYVKLNGAGEGDLSTGGPLASQLEQGEQKLVADLRDKVLVHLNNGAQVRQIEIDEEGRKLVLADYAKPATGMEQNDWKILEPMQTKADAAEAGALSQAATGLRAESFVAPNSPEVLAADFEHPRFTVTLRTEPPSTQPSKSQQNVTLVVGQYTDPENKQSYVRVNDTNTVAKVESSALTSLEKKPIELRDKAVLDVNPEEVSRFTIASDVPAATQPSTRPAKKGELTIERRHPTGIPFATSQPATNPATTKYTLHESKAVSSWTASDGSAVDDSEVHDFLNALHPLRVENYLESNPATQPTVSHYTVKIHTEAAGGAKGDLEIQFADRGGEQPLMGEYNALTFEVSRATFGRFLEGDFKKKATPPTPSSPELPAGHPPLGVP